MSALRANLKGIIIIAVVVILCVAGIMFYENRIENEALKDILGPLFEKYEVVESRRGEILLFGRSPFVWHLKFRGDLLELPKDAHRSDSSNLEYAVQSISNMLNRELSRVEYRQVFVKSVGDRKNDTAYILVRPGGIDIYIYLFRP